jgi:hypothetical protein
MTGSYDKPDLRWALKGRLIVLPGATLFFGGLALNIFGGELGWIGGIMMSVGTAISWAGVAQLRKDRKNHIQGKLPQSGDDGG